MLQKTEKAFAKAFDGFAPDHCNMTNEQKVTVKALVEVYLRCANMVLELTYILQARHVRTELAGRNIASLDGIVQKTGLRGNDPRLGGCLALRDNLVREATPLPPEAVKACTQAINGILDSIAPLQPLVDSIIKYTTKLAILELDVEKIVSAIEDLKFAKKLAIELDA